MGLAALAATASLLSSPAVLHAQSNPTLEELIPDTAVENPEIWSQDGIPADAPTDIVNRPILTNKGTDGTETQPLDPNAPSDPSVENTDTGATGISPDNQTTQMLAPLDPNSPLAELPDMVVQWPEDLNLPDVVPLETDEGIQFADNDLLQSLDFDNAEIVEIDKNLVLAIIPGLDGFPIKDGFVARFSSLSAVEVYEDGDTNLAQIAARAKADTELLNEMLRVYGYYDGQVIRSVSAGKGEDGQDLASTVEDAVKNAVVRFDIVPGSRYKIAAIDLGQLASAPDADSLRAAFGIYADDPVSKDAIIGERSDLDQALAETGYPFAAIDAPELLIDHEKVIGDLSMPVEPNGKYTFGGVVSSDPKFLSGSHLASIARFDPGDIYQRSQENDLRQAIITTGLVSSVTISPREITPPAGEIPGVVALDIELTPAPLRTIAGAIGYGSEEGVRIEASWEHRNFFPPEGAFKVRGILGTREQLLGATFRKNNFRGRDRVLTLDAYASTIDSDAFDARTLAVVGTYELNSTLIYQKPFSWSLGFEALATDERPAPVANVVQPRDTYFIGAIPVSALYDTTDDLLDPTSGFRIGGRLSPEFSQSNSNWHNYYRAQIDASYYKQATDKVIAATRFRLGSIAGTDLSDIAPSRRFYAGGGASVRGYGYQQIGPKDIAGQPTGGRSVIEFSAEARIRTSYFDGALSIVPFLDAGSVSRQVWPDFEEIKVGAGIGIRYHTLIGPIRVDVGVPLNPDPGDSPIGVYVSLGQAF